MLTLKEISRIFGIEGALSEFADKEINSISTDTRTIKEGDFYLPLKGENFDGEKFISDALKKGAIGYFYTSDESLTPEVSAYDVLRIKTSDTKLAYLKLANFYRKKINPKVVMITGSSGKTTTKELVYSVVSQKYNTIKTPLNHNNEIGFCQTVFEMNKDTEVLIIEAGMRGLGEIELIAKHANPDIGIISNVGTAHIGRLGSRENIAKAKCEITTTLNPNGVLIAHNNDLIKKTVAYEGKKIYYSIDDVEITKKEIGSSEFIYNNNKYRLNIEGDYNIENSLAAINAGKFLDIDYELIRRGLDEYKPIEKRWEIENVRGFNIINDSYNANPESMKAAISTVVDLYPDAVLVLGDMGELGKDEELYHSQIGEFINTKKGTFIVLTVGNLAKNISDNINICFSKNFTDSEAVSKYILDNIKVGTTIFLKASRSMKFEQIIKNLKGEHK